MSCIADPSVNHLIIAPTIGPQASHTFSTDTNNDFDRVEFGSSGVGHAYYLMWSGFAYNAGVTYGEAHFQSVLDAFEQSCVTILAPHQPPGAPPAPPPRAPPTPPPHAPPPPPPSTPPAPPATPPPPPPPRAPPPPQGPPSTITELLTAEQVEAVQAAAAVASTTVAAAAAGATVAAGAAAAAPMALALQRAVMFSDVAGAPANPTMQELGASMQWVTGRFDLFGVRGDDGGDDNGGDEAAAARGNASIADASGSEPAQRRLLYGGGRRLRAKGAAQRARKQDGLRRMLVSTLADFLLIGLTFISAHATLLLFWRFVLNRRHYRQRRSQVQPAPATFTSEEGGGGGGGGAPPRRPHVARRGVPTKAGS